MKYEDIRAVRWSRLKEMRTSPLQYKHACEREDTPPAAAMLVGLAAHAWLLEPDDFERLYICYPKQRRGKAWEAFREDHADKYILNDSEWKRALGTAMAVIQHPIASRYLSGGVQEHTITWTDPETEIDCKARVDHAGSHLVDVKTTGVIQPERFYSHAARLGYHGQLAFYLDGLRANGFEVDVEPILIAAQSEPPHDVVVYKMPPMVVNAGRRLYRQLLQRVAACRAAGEWPGIATEEQDLQLPEWAFLDDGPLELTMGGEAIGGF